LHDLTGWRDAIAGNRSTSVWPFFYAKETRRMTGFLHQIFSCYIAPELF
jgi:hypothetical protein